ncbi:PREDICTED: transcription factor bHLH106-like [Ipomoea nil]|uniref:transcription factor bHLH106-like n=1 Tax=Ipomoea nil TaxID=35883 RepID=UPI0009010B5F|nr:PREDICTED: transcription factor bHLH106-like [Ipomoea nil]
MQPDNTPEIFDYYYNNNYYSLSGNAASSYGLPATYEIPPPSNHESFCSSAFYHTELPETVSDCTPEARALAASKNHREAERRRRERINSHLDCLRTLLPCNSRTDKASLLAKVVERVRELKEEASELMEIETGIPSESDEITLLLSSDDECSGDGRLVIKASLCCEDRMDLIPDLIHTLKSLRLSPLRAEMVTLGGRIRNVFILAGDLKDHACADESSILFLRNALKSVVERSACGAGERSKRRRMIDHGVIN